MIANFATQLRMKLIKEEFLRLIKLSQREIVYRVKKIHFFPFDGFVFYCKECEDIDFEAVIIATELSNVNIFWER